MRAGLRQTDNNLVRGFTLVELLVVITLIGIIAGITTPRWMRTLDNYRFQVKVNDFVSFVRYVRERAIVSKRKYKIVVSPEGKGYTVITGDSEAGKGEFSRFLKGAVFPDGTVVEASKNEIEFDQNGETIEIEINFTSKAGQKIQVKVFGYGRIKVK